ncbi:glycine cleavage system protein GcvH [Acinetobacter baumannii A424]|nr:glycine cleavage system protein GcvH [Acinetobacter baumannii A424]
MNHPSELKYARTHEWVKIEGDLVITGITDHAQDELGDLVYVETPEVGSQVTAGEQAGVVESVKTASDIHAPVSGTVVEVNTDLEDDPDFVNEDPYGKGWIYKIKPDNIADVEKLLTNAEYEAGDHLNLSSKQRILRKAIQ